MDPTLPTSNPDDRNGPAPAVSGYHIERELGRGGMGVVYQARQTALNRVVALKMILAGGYASAAELQRFRAEAEAIARLQHPNIVQIYEVGEQDGLPYFSLEFCPGGSLDRKLNGTPLVPLDAAALVETLARAVQAAHDKGIVHRDLSPGNILLAADGTPKISDFGLAKQVGETTKTATGAIVGTPSYMSPEQASGRGKEAGPACDVYALGAILYECLVGRPPFKAATPLDTLLQVIADEPVSPRSLNGGLPRDLDIICLKCLQKEPHKRYDSALSLAEDLARFRRGEPIVARPVSAPERGLKWVKRNAFVSSATAAMLLSLTAGLVLSLWQLNRANKEAARADAKTGEAQEEKRVAQEEKERADREKRRAETELDRAERLVYAGQLALAQQAFQNGEGHLAVGYLSACARQRRGWEHRHLATRFDSRQSFLGHGDTVTGVACSPDGKRLASSSEDRTVKLWEAETGRELRTLTGHTEAVYCLAFSPDGKRLASGSGSGEYDPPNRPGEVKVWEVDSGRVLWTLKGHTDQVSSLAFSPDGRRLATAGYDDTVKIWDATKGVEMQGLKGHTSGVTGVAFSPDGKQLVSASLDQTAIVWDANSWKKVHILSGNEDRLWSVAFSPDGQWIVTGGSGQRLKLWDANTGRQLDTIGDKEVLVHSVTFSPDGSRIAYSGVGESLADEGKIWVVDLATKQTVATLKGHTAWAVMSVAFHPDGQRLFSGGTDYTVKGWQVDGGQDVLTVLADPEGVNALAFHPHGHCFASAGIGRTVRVWETATGRLLQQLDGHTSQVRCLAYSPDGKCLASGSSDALDAEGSGEIRLWDVATGSERFVLKGHAETGATLAISANGKWLAGQGRDGATKVWDMRTAKELLSVGDKDEGDTVRVAFSPDNKFLVRSLFGSIRFHDVETGSVQLSLDEVGSVFDSVFCFSPDGKRMVLARDSNDLPVWDIEKRAHMFSLTGHAKAVHDFTFSPDGRRIASVSQDRTVRLWDAWKGQELLTLRGHRQTVTSVAFSPDGNHLLTGSYDGTVKIWAADRGIEPVTLCSVVGFSSSVAFSPDGKRAFTWDVENKPLAWTVPDGKFTAPIHPPHQPDTTSVYSPDGAYWLLSDSWRVCLIDVAVYRRQNHWPLPDRAERLRYHGEQAQLAEKQKQWFAVAFHLGRLLRDRPDDADLKRKRDEALRKHASVK